MSLAEKSTILVVEDDPISRKLLRLLLERAGYLVETVVDGERAIHLL